MEKDFTEFLDSLTPLERDILKTSLVQYLNNEDDNEIPNHINSDNILLKIGELGQESMPMFNQFKDQFTDAKPALIGFAMTNGMRSDSIQPVFGKEMYTTPLGNSLSSVNELHTEAKTMMDHIPL